MIRRVRSALVDDVDDLAFILGGKALDVEVLYAALSSADALRHQYAQGLHILELVQLQRVVDETIRILGEIELLCAGGIAGGGEVEVVTVDKSERQRKISQSGSSRMHRHARHNAVTRSKKN